MSDDPDTPDERSPGTLFPGLLERRYRRALRLLPAEYRAVREQEMVDAFVQSCADADPELADVTVESGWPDLRELASVVALALRLRWADPRGPRRYRVMTGALRSATLLALAVLAVTAATGVLGSIRLAVAPPPDLPHLDLVDILFGGDSGVWSLLRGWSYVLWIPALILAALGGRRGTTWALAATAVPLAVSVVTTIASPFSFGSTFSFGVADWAWVVAQIAVLAGLAGTIAAPQDDRERPRHGRLLAVAGVLVGLDAVLMAASTAFPEPVSVLGYVILDSAGFWCAAAVIAGVALVVGRIRGTPVNTEALLAVAFLAGAATVLRATTLPVWIQFLPQNGSALVLISTVIQLLLAAAITLTAGILAGLSIRRMPPVSYRTR